MLRRFLRIPVLRILAPHVKPPVLPVSRLTHTPRISQARLFSQFPARLAEAQQSPTSQQGPLPPSASLSQRLKHLIKSYGWYALGVYLVIGVVDFSIAFAGINLIGAEHVSHATSAVKEAVYNLIYSKPLEPGRDEIESVSSPNSGTGKEGIYAMIVLAYTVHKTLFVPIRLGLTAWLTPRLVNWLRLRGWAGGEGTRRAAAEMREKIRNSRSKD